MDNLKKQTDEQKIWAMQELVRAKLIFWDAQNRAEKKLGCSIRSWDALTTLCSTLQSYNEATDKDLLTLAQALIDDNKLEEAK